MRRTTVKIPDELDARLRQEAARRGVTISRRHLFRAALVLPGIAAVLLLLWWRERR